MKNYLLIIIFPLFLHSQTTTKVSITKAEIIHGIKQKKIALEYLAESLKVNRNAQARITKAEAIFEDNTSENLEFSEFYDLGNPNPLNVIYFKAPKNKINNIKSLSGTIEYFNPTIENGDVIILENPQTKNSTRIFRELLDFEFYMVDVNALLKLKKLKKSKRYIEAQKLIGISDLSLDFKKSLDNFFKNLPVSFINPTGVFFYIFDPTDRFYTIRIVNENGEFQTTNYSGSSDSAWKYFQVTSNTIDKKLAFIFHSKNSVREFDFKELNINIKNANGL